MTKVRVVPLLVISVILLMSLFLTPTGASGNNRVGLVIDFGNGDVATQCVSFAEESITGHEALQRTGLPIETDFQTGGAAVCRINGQGCPSSDCFCACRGGNDCKYWSYWHLTNGVWGYSAIGAGMYELKDGAVDGWVWGLGSVTQASPPPAIPFGEICTDGAVNTPTVTPTASRTLTPIVMPTSPPPPGSGFVATSTLAPTSTTQSEAATSQATPGVTVTTEDQVTPIGTSSVTVPTRITQQPAIQGNEPSDSPILIGGQTNDETVIQATNPALELSQLPQSQSFVTPETTVEVLPDSADNGVAGDADPIALAAQSVEPAIVQEKIIPTPMEVAGIVGENVIVGRPAPSQVVGGDDVQAATWGDYIGYAGLLLMIAALTLFVYNRRSGSRDRRAE